LAASAGLGAALAAGAVSAQAPDPASDVVFDSSFGQQPGAADYLPDPDGTGVEFQIDYCPSCDALQLPGGSHGKLIGAGSASPGLLQSLTQIDVGKPDAVLFAASEGVAISNLFVRVTGTKRSEIFGALRSNLNADLYLLNPYGVMFGESAELDVNGSFHVSTADELLFDGGQKFVARVGGEVPTLAVAAPEYFGFWVDEQAPATIWFDKTAATPTAPGPSFAVPEGKTFSAIAGRIEIVGRNNAATNIPTLASQGGLIQLAAVPSGTDVPIDVATLPVENLGPEGAIDQAAIHLTQNAIVTVRGSDPATSIPARMVIRGGRFEMEQEQGIVKSGELIAFPTGAGEGELGIDVEVAGTISVDAGRIRSQYQDIAGGRGGDIRLVASEIYLADTIIFNPASIVPAGVQSEFEFVGGFVANDGPDIYVEADTVSIRDGARLRSSDELDFGLGTGDVGDIDIVADFVEVSGEGSEISTTGAGVGDGGTIRVEGRESITVSNGGQILSNRVRLFIPDDPGDPGRVDVLAGALNLVGGSIGSVTTAGDGADVTVDAQTILIETSESAPDVKPQISALAARGADAGATGGSLTVHAASIGLRDGGQIRTTTEGDAAGGKLDVHVEGTLLAAGRNVRMVGEDVIVAPSGVFARSALPKVAAGDPPPTPTTGSGGQLDITAETVQLEGGAEISASAESEGPAGSVFIVADAVSVEGTVDADGIPIPSLISAGGGLIGPGGIVDIETDSLRLHKGGQISTSAIGAGGAGDIDIRAREIDISGAESRISARTLNPFVGAGNAGGVSLSPVDGERLTLRIGAGGAVSVESTVLGAAGEIEISGAALVEVTEGGEINATVQDVAVADADLASDIRILDTDLVRISGGTITTETLGSGAGGTIEIQAAQVDLSNAARITARSVGTSGAAGDAGAIVIAATRSFRADNSEITTTARANDAGGGRISIQARDQVYFLDSLVETTVEGETAGADAGDIFIPLGGEEAIGVDPVVPKFVVVNRSVIKANAVASGAGDITIDGANVIISADSLIEAHSEEGVSGEIQVSAPDADIASQVAQLPSSFVDPSNRLLPPCVARTERTGSFMVQNREALPRSPDAPLPSDLTGAPGIHSVPPASGSTDCSVFQEKS
jgi:filamentous hemagglutinin family protein